MCRRRHYVDLRISIHKKAAEPHSAARAADFIAINVVEWEQRNVYFGRLENLTLITI